MLVNQIYEFAHVLLFSSDIKVLQVLYWFILFMVMRIY